MADKETKEDYKARVQKAKRIVQQMFVEGQKKDIPMYKIEMDVESFLDSQNLTKFDLRTNGDRKNQAVLQAFTNKANKGIMEILKVIAPSVAVQLDLKKFGILDFDDLMERDKEVREGTINFIEELFTEVLPGMSKPLYDEGFNPEKLGERIADQMGESLVEFIPIIVAPNLLAAKGPIEGLRLTLRADPTKMQKVVDVLNNSMKSILNMYIQTPVKTFFADIAASSFWGAGEQMGQEITESAEKTQALGYYDIIKGRPLETLTGISGATFGVALANALSGPKRTLKTLKNIAGLASPKNIYNKLTNWTHKRNIKKIDKALTEIIKTHQEEIAAAGRIAEEVSKTPQRLFETTGKQGPVQEGPKLKLTLAEETLSPGVRTEQIHQESKMVGGELDKIIQRRVDNLNALDESLATIVPKTDKNFQYFLDLRTGTIQPLIKKLEQQIATKADEIAAQTQVVKPDLTSKESGFGLRDKIDTLQFKESEESLRLINAIPEGKNVVDTEILDDLLASLSRVFETGTEPKILTKINKLINLYKPKYVEEPIFDKDGLPVMTKDSLGNEVQATKTIEIPAERELTNQALYDIWLSAGLEETSLIGKAGIENASKLQKLSTIKAQIYSKLQDNLLNTKGGMRFFNEVDKYINNFEKGVIVRVRENKVAGHAVKDEAVADSFFQPNNVAAMEDFIRVFGKDSNAVFNMQQSILDRIANESIDISTGLLNVDKYRRFLAKYASSLKEFETISPEFVTSLKETPTVIGALSERLATLNTRKTFLDGEKLKNTLKIFGGETKQLNLGTVDEYVAAALADSKLMGNLTQRIQKADAGDVWIRSVLENLTKLRPHPNTGEISPKEIINMKAFLKNNAESLDVMFKELGPGYKNHLENINAIINGFERANFVPPSKGSPALTPSEQVKQTLGINVSTFWSRWFAVQSGRVGKNYMGMEVLNRLVDTVGAGHFDKIMKQAVFDPAFAKTLSGMVKGGKLSIKDMKNLYGFLAKLNGTIGMESENGAEDATPADEARSKLFQMAPTPSVSFDQPPVVPESRMSQNPVGTIGTPTQPAQMASIYPQTMAGGQPDRIDPGRAAIAFGPMDILAQPRSAAQGGIMSTNKAFQKVA